MVVAMGYNIIYSGGNYIGLTVWMAR